MDPMLLVSYCPRSISFLVAAKSMKGIVGFFARAFRSVPCARPQDTAKKGSGTVSFEQNSTRVFGNGTQFLTEFDLEKHAIAPKGCEPSRIKEIISDTELILHTPAEETVSDVPFKIYDKIDQSEVYSNVWEQLGKGECIGIFPEGGSHDRTELLPLKAGVSVMALGAMELHGKPVYIVPCGLNYYRGHRFRGDCLVEFGRPYKIPLSMVKLYKENRRQACSQLLKVVKEHMETVIISAPDFQTLQEVTLTRRLYQGSHVLPADKYIELHHRFLEAWRIFGDREEMKEYRKELRGYLSELKHLGLRDAQVLEASQSSGNWVKVMIFVRLFLVIMTLTFALPGAILNLPIGIAARYTARKHAKEALKASDVKIAARDVLASKKVVTALKLTLPLYIVYGIIAATYFDAWLSILFFTFLPFMTLATIRFAEEGIVLGETLRSMVKIKWMYGEKIASLQQKREQLRKTIIEAVALFGPSMAGSADISEWRIIKEEQLEEGSSPALRGKKKSFRPLTALDTPIISDDLTDIFN